MQVESARRESGFGLLRLTSIRGDSCPGKQFTIDVTTVQLSGIYSQGRDQRSGHRRALGVGFRAYSDHEGVRGRPFHCYPTTILAPVVLSKTLEEQRRRARTSSISRRFCCRLLCFSSQCSGVWPVPAMYRGTGQLRIAGLGLDALLVPETWLSSVRFVRIARRRAVQEDESAQSGQDMIHELTCYSCNALSVHTAPRCASSTRARSKKDDPRRQRSEASERLIRACPHSLSAAGSVDLPSQQAFDRRPPAQRTKDVRRFDFFLG